MLRKVRCKQSAQCRSSQVYYNKSKTLFEIITGGSHGSHHGLSSWFGASAMNYMHPVKMILTASWRIKFQNTQYWCNTALLKLPACLPRVSVIVLLVKLRDLVYHFFLTSVTRRFCPLHFGKCLVLLMGKTPLWDYLAEWALLGIQRKNNFLSPE